MRTSRARQAGLTLLELLVALPVAVLLVLPLLDVVQGGLRLRDVAAERIDVAQQARFAMQRITAAARAAPSGTLAAKAANTTGDWLGPVAFCLNGAAQLVETTPADAGCAGTRVICERVSAFSVQTFDAGPGARKVIEIQLAVAGPRGQVAPLLAHARLGGGAP